MSLIDVLFAAVAGLAGLVQTVAGFGFMLVASTLGALLLPMPELVPLALPLSLVSSAWVAYDQRRLIDRHVIFKVILPAMLVGAALGFGLSGVFPSTVMRRLLGVIVLGFVVLRVVRRGATPRVWPAWLRSFVIVCAGIVQGLFGTGGPLLVLALEGMQLGAGPFRATLMSVWVLINSALVTAMFVDGRYDLSLLTRLAMAVPAVAMGVWIGQHLHRRLSPQRFQLAVYAMLSLAAVALLRG